MIDTHYAIGVDAAANPFRFGALALDEAFTNREREIAELRADVTNGQDVVVFAPAALWQVVVDVAGGAGARAPQGARRLGWIS